MLKSKAGKSIESELQKIHKNNIDSFKKITYVDGYKISLKNIENKKLMVNHL